MKQTTLLTLSYLLSVTIQAQDTRHITGLVRDQDGNAIKEAEVSVEVTDKGEEKYLYATTDEDGHYTFDISKNSYCTELTVKADGHTQYIGEASEDSEQTVVLYNSLHFEAGKRASLFLPIPPDSLAGRYYRLDHFEGEKIVFEREFSPQAYYPYIFFPYEDMTIDLRGLDLTPINRAIKVEAEVQEGIHQGDMMAMFWGSTFSSDFGISYGWDFMPVEEDVTDKYAQDIVTAMHATIIAEYWMFHTTQIEDGKRVVIPPELSFHDPEDNNQGEVPTSVNNKWSNDRSAQKETAPLKNCFDLTGHRLAAPPVKGVYIRDGKKMAR